MARFSMTGLDEAIRQLDLAADTIKERAPAAVLAGARVAQEAMRASVPVETGELRDSITVSDVRHTVADGYYADVEPTGNRKGQKKTTNAQVGYVLEYGRSNMPARPWMRPAIERSAEDVQRAMVNVLAGDGA